MDSEDLAPEEIRVYEREASENWRQSRLSRGKDNVDPYYVEAWKRIDGWDAIRGTLDDLEAKPYFVDTASAPALLGDLRSRGFAVKDFDARGLDDEALLRGLGALFDFPDQWNVGWEGFTDWYSKFVEASPDVVVLAAHGFDAMMAADFRRFYRVVSRLEYIRECIGLVRPVIPRCVVNLYVGDWG